MIGTVYGACSIFLSSSLFNFWRPHAVGTTILIFLDEQMEVGEESKQHLVPLREGQAREGYRAMSDTRALCLSFVMAAAGGHQEAVVESQPVT